VNAWLERGAVAAILVFSANAAAAATLTAEQAERLVADVTRKVESIRQMSFKSPVRVSVIDDEAARRYALARFRRFTSDEEIRAQQRAFVLLGLLPPGADIIREYLDVLEEQAGGYYDPTTKAFYLLDDMPAGTAPFLAAHELTHALEDQHFDLDRRLSAAKGDDDAMFAASAVHEGSATLVMALYSADALAEGSLKADDLRALAESESGRGEKLKALPPVLRRELLGVYLLGAGFLLRGKTEEFASGKLPAADVDRAYRGGPRSSEQILHPEKYWEASSRDDPVKVKLDGVGRVLGDGWNRTGAWTLGELTLGLLVGAPTPADAMSEQIASPGTWSNAAASGWGGDRLEVWSNKDRSIALLKTIWDTPEDAREFAAALPARPSFAWKRSGRTVAIVAGADREDVLLFLAKP
jgi:hypothetical protein